jgi:tocopherol cyclase
MHGNLTIKLWRHRVGHPQLLLAATSSQAGLEVGGGPWENPWIKP